jgi:hypothetical protein
VLKASSFDEVANWVIPPLRTAGISDYSVWCIDVPEFLRTPYELYTRLNSSQPADAPEYQAIEPQLTNIVNDYGTSQGLVLRHQRLLWQAFLSKACFKTGRSDFTVWLSELHKRTLACMVDVPHPPARQGGPHGSRAS